MKNFIDWKKLTLLSQGNTDINIPLELKVMKLSEEVGELSQAALKQIGANNVSASASHSADAVLEEACDVLNVTLDIIISMGFKRKEVENMFSTKLDKWERKVNQFR